MRPVLVVVGVIVLLLGVVWTLQGAYVLEATFMRGPLWIGIGGVAALVGVIIVVFGFRLSPPAKAG